MSDELAMTTENDDKTKPCPICGKMISTKPQVWAMHARSCEQKQVESMVKIPETVDPAIALDIAMARKAAALRLKQAPDVAGSMREDNSELGQKTDMIKNLKLIPEGYSLFWGKTSEQKTYLSRGYEPIILSGYTVDVAEMRAYMVPAQIPKAEHAAACLESKRRLGDLLGQGDEGSLKQVKPADADANSG